MIDDRDRWNARWRAVSTATEPKPPGVLPESVGYLPTSGRAVDLAGGAGDGALWLAQRGLDTTLAEVSDVALDLAEERAAALRLNLTTLQVDLDEAPVPAGPWDVIACSHYLNRPLLAALSAELAPGGIVVVGIATTTNLERHERPSARFLLEPAELPSLVGGQVTVLRHVEDWAPWGVHEARLVATRIGPASAKQ